MKVLLVAHRYPPRNHAGVEVYTAGLARALVARGHQVEVFCADKDIAAPDRRVRVREYEGVRVHELVNNLMHDDLSESYLWAPAEAAFAQVLDDCAPDVVHFTHLLYLSLGCAARAQERGIPAIYTLHDFWLQCARFGQRLRGDDVVCHEIDPAICARCVAAMPFAQPRMERRVAPWVARIKSWSGVDVSGGLRRIAKLTRPRPAAPASTPAPVGEQAVFRAARVLEARDAYVRGPFSDALFAYVAPSRFLRDEFLRWGLPRKKVVQLRSGIDVESLKPAVRVRHSPLRVAFIGTVAPHKGAHVLLEAWARAALGTQAELAIYGHLGYRPEYVDALKKRAQQIGVRLMGEIAHERIAALLAQIDLLVVPSIWYENSPLIIQEAQALKTPLLVSDLGGMRELVEESVSGFRFRAGDAGDLADHLRRLCAEPARLDALYPDGPLYPRTIREDAADLEALYQRAIDAQSSEGAS